MAVQTASSTCRWRGDGSILPGCGVQGAAGAVSLLGGATSQEPRLPASVWRNELGSCHGWAGAPGGSAPPGHAGRAGEKVAVPAGAPRQ